MTSLRPKPETPKRIPDEPLLEVNMPEATIEIPKEQSPEPTLRRSPRVRKVYYGFEDRKPCLMIKAVTQKVLKLSQDRK